MSQMKELRISAHFLKRSLANLIFKINHFRGEYYNNIYISG
jgi:hypothetical protein